MIIYLRDEVLNKAPEFPYGETTLRPGWASLPSALKERIESVLGAKVASSTSQGGGFSGGFASILTLVNGERVFLKAAEKAGSLHVINAYQKELEIVRALPKEAPAPAFLWSFETEEWLVLAFEAVSGRNPVRPWAPAELELVLDMLEQLADTMTPATDSLLPLRGLLDDAEGLHFWQDAASGDAKMLKLVPTSWQDRVPELAVLEVEALTHARGDTASHFDVRDDNLLITDEGRVLLCDWNWLTLSAPWTDLVGMLISVHEDGIDVEEIVRTHSLTRDVNPIAITSFLVALAGLFVRSAAEDPLPSSPWLRVHQAHWRDATLSWLSLRLLGEP